LTRAVGRPIRSASQRPTRLASAPPMSEKMMSSGVAGVSAGSPAAAGGVMSPAQVTEHLIQLPGGPGGLWRWAALRGTGFPANEVLKLSSPECAAADLVLRLEDEAEQARALSLELVNESLDALRDGDR
jgi:hypothetical protein